MLDRATGALLLGARDLPPAARTLAERLLGPGRVVGCARPPRLLPPPAGGGGGPWLRVAGYYHGSLHDGPGRRSSLLVQGCSIGRDPARRCAGCWVPHLHPLEGGTAVGVERLAEALLDPAEPRDGVSVLGGEPFDQAEGVLALVVALRARGCGHVCVYSGFTLEELRERASRRPAVGALLEAIDMLVDGRYVASLAEGAGAWTGSANQRAIDLAAMRRERENDPRRGRESGCGSASPASTPGR